MKKISLLLLAVVSFAAYGATTLPVQLLNPTGSSSGQTIVSTGSGTAPGWATVPLSGLSSIAANTVVANFTGSSAAPVAFAMPSCSTSSSILQYTSGTGVTCSTTIWASPPAIGGTAANSGAFTSLSASGAVSGVGFSNYLASPPAIGTTTPGAGKFLNLQSTGTYTPSSTSGIIGTTTNDNANAGSWGEFPTPTNLSGVSLTSGTAANCASISLAAGDWDVTGSVNFVPAATTTANAYQASISATSATNPSNTSGATNLISGVTFAANSQQVMSAPVVRQSLASTTTIYLVGTAAFSTSTMTCNGFIRARRVR